MKHIFLFLLCFLSFLTKSQTSDTFSSSYITATNAWTGDTASFYVTTDGWLQLDDLYEQGNASLQLPVNYNKNMEWELDVQLYFNSSNANNVRLYVLSSGENIDPDETHYYVQVGHNDDNISLYSVKGTATAKRLIKGRLGLLDKEDVEVNVKLRLENGTHWKLYSRLSDETSYRLEGDTILKQVVIPPSGTFKINCRYSKTRSYHFAFDNLLITGDSIDMADTMPPCITAIEAISDSILRFTFDEPIESSAASCSIDEMGPVSIKTVSANANQLLVVTPDTMINGNEYTLCWENLTDLSGNVLVDNCLQFTFSLEEIPPTPDNPDIGIPDEEDPGVTFSIKPFDIIFNEILPDPHTGGSEYIELYNRSGGDLRADSLSIAIRKIDGSLATIYPLSGLEVTIVKDSYLVLTKDKEGVLMHYDTPTPELIRSVKLPTLANTSSTVVLLNHHTKEVIDEISYSHKWHNAFVSDSKGFALERIDPESTTQDQRNWATAAAEAGHGTPGFQNTQYGVIKDGPQTSIEIPVFSPDNNCWNLAYHTDQSGYSCRIMVFDPAGRQVAILKNHELIGQKGSLFWDGKGNGGKKLSAGLYILYAEIYHPSGVIYRSKKAFSYF